MRSGFGGFPPEAMTFYRGLVRNNTREWFQPRKHIYDEKVKAPMVELVSALNEAMMQFAPEYVTDAAKAVFRIYRDTRFSADKTPYKTQIAAYFSHRGLAKHGAAGFYFAVSLKGVDVGGGIYMPPPPTLLAVRNHIAERHAELQKITAAHAVKKLFGAMQGEQLTRVPKGFCADHPGADLLRHKQFLLFATLDAALITTPKLLPELEKRFRAMMPFLEFLNAPLAAKAKKPSTAI